MCFDYHSRQLDEHNLFKLQNPKKLCLSPSGTLFLEILLKKAFWPPDFLNILTVLHYRLFFSCIEIRNKYLDDELERISHLKFDTSRASDIFICLDLAYYWMNFLGTLS